MVRTLKGSPYQSVSEFFDYNGAKAQRYRLDPTRRTVLVGEKGTRLTFPPFALVDVSGRIVTEAVEILLTEIFSKSEMLLSDKVSTSEDRLLESGGQLLMQAVLDHQLLDLQKPVTVELPVNPALNNPVAMRLFEGSTTKTRAFCSDRAFDWKLVSRRTVPVVKVGGKKFFRFLLHRSRWVNCDYFFAKHGSRTMVSVRCISQTEEIEDQAAFLVFRDFNAVARMYPGGRGFTSFNIPTRLAATVIVIGLAGGQLYFGATEVDKMSRRLIPVELYPAGESTILEYIQQL